MCGIVGSACAPRESREWISNATLALKHRGPDDNGWVQIDDISLGMTRLAIVDLEGGVQPFISLDNRYSLVFNGQIYNFRKLRTQLENLGYKFRSASDTEVILHAYIQYREQVVEHLEGMFAFAIWDSLEKTLFIARDKFGEKPLSFAHLPNGGIVFSSEIKALLSHPDVSKNPDIDSIQLMLNFGYVPSPRSAFEDIKKLPPAHFLIWRNKSFTMTKYWEPPTAPRAHRLAIAKVRARAALNKRCARVQRWPMAGSTFKPLGVAKRPRFANQWQPTHPCDS